MTVTHSTIDTSAAFIMPHWSSGTDQELRWLNSALQSILNQTDERWKLFIIDDASPDQEAKNYLQETAEAWKGKLEVIFSNNNNGPGYARNLGILRAYQSGYPYILFLDSDDIAHPRRVEITREIFLKRREAGVVYSTFTIIDEYDKVVPPDKIAPSILEITETHHTNPPQGNDVWITIATVTGYINLTSATAVRTSIAHAYPFPCEKVSEDFYTWLMYSAGGAQYFYTPLIPAYYRIPQHIDGSNSRNREGGQHQFNITKSRVDSLGFKSAAELALKRGTITKERLRYLQVLFLLRRAVSMGKDREFDLAKKFYQEAVQLDKVIFDKLAIELHLEKAAWID